MIRPANLDLGVIGNGTFGALLDATRHAWCGVACPRSTAIPRSARCFRPSATAACGASSWRTSPTSEQHYLPNTAILRTILRDRNGGAVEITDFAPRWRHYNRLYRPVMLYRRVRPLAGAPRIRISLHRSPTGARANRSAPGAATTCAGCCRAHVLRLTTDLSAAPAAR